MKYAILALFGAAGGLVGVMTDNYIFSGIVGGIGWYVAKVFEKK